MSTTSTETRNAVNIEVKKTVFAGGCFWGLQELIRQQPGVLATQVGYTGGSVQSPTYHDHEGHAEAVEIMYDPTQTSYTNLLDFFFRAHDPTTLNQQGNDRGTAYRSAIFYADQAEKKQAEDFIELVNLSGRWSAPVITTLEPLNIFYPAEEEHQDYLQKNPAGYTCHWVRFESLIPPTEI
jgi:peptide-methionine (S)-S-oxide reductase